MNCAIAASPSNEQDQLESPPVKNTESGGQATTYQDGQYYGAVFDDDINKISIDDAIEQLGMGKFQYLLLLCAGLCFAADSMEVLLLSFLSLIVQSEWGLSDEKTSSITSSVFAGALLGTLMLGPLGDTMGRKPIFVITATIIAIFGLLTTFVTSFEALVICRFFVGVGVGGLTVPFDVYAEFLPVSHRGTQLLLIEYFWTAGTMLVPVLAYFTIGQQQRSMDQSYEDTAASASDDAAAVVASYSSVFDLLPEEFWAFFISWRFFVLLCSIPCIVSSLLAMQYVPESPRWLLAKGNDQQGALAVLRKAAIINGKDPNMLFPEGIIIIHDENRFCNTNGLADLLSSKWLNLTIPLWGVWLSYSFLYYGAIIMVTVIFSKEDENENQQVDGSDDADVGTRGSYSFDFGAILVSATAEIFGLTFVILSVDKFGRIMSQIVSYLFGGLMLLSLCYFASLFQGDYQYLGVEEEVSPENYMGQGTDDSESVFEYTRSQHFTLMAFAFLARMFMMSGSCTTWVTTAEVLATEIRTTGHSAANAVARLGGVLCPYLATQHTGLMRVGFTFFFISLFAAFCASNLPETKHLSIGSVPTPSISIEEEKKKNKISNMNKTNSFPPERTKALL